LKKILSVILILTALIIVATACGKQAAPAAGQEEDQSAVRTATAEARLASIPEDVPIMEGAENLKVGANDTYIAFEAEGALDDVVQYYRDQLEQLGWEKRGSSPEQPIGGAQTLLRYKPEKNISVTIQSIPESTKVRVLMTLIPTR
jgi:hypothetical protein